MKQRELEVNILSAQSLKNVKTFGKMTPYAVAWVYPNRKYPTPMDPKGNVNPTWNESLKLMVEERAIEQGVILLVVDIYSHGSFGNKQIGSCHVPLTDLKRKEDKEGKVSEAKFMSVPVMRPSGRTQGVLNLSVRLGDIVEQPQAQMASMSAPPYMAAPQGAGKGQPVTAYPAGYAAPGYGQPGASQPYPQYPPGPYPAQMAPPYYPQAGGYAAVPPPQRKSNGMLGGGLGAGLLGGALGGLLLGEVIGGGFGSGDGGDGGGCGGGGCGGGGCGG